LVDYVSLEAEKAGHSAAKHAQLGKLPPAGIRVKPGSGIRYVVPQFISGTEAVDFSMRVVAPDQNRQVVFRSGGQTVRKMRENVLAPSSMIRFRVRADRLQKIDGELTVEIEA
jgi:hypothetical protein